MATSYLSLNDIAVRGAETGFGTGVKLENEDYQISKNAEREDFREKMLNERYQLQLKNALAEKSLYYTHEAEKIASMDAKTAAQYQNTNMINAAFKNIEEEIAPAKNALLPANRKNITDASAKNAQDIITAGAKSRFAVASLQPQPTPGNIHGVLDQNQLEALSHPVDKDGNPMSFTPQYTQQYQDMQQLQLDAEIAKVKGVGLSNKIKAKKIDGSAAGLSPKETSDFAKNIYTMNGLAADVPVASKPLNDIYQTFGASVLSDVKKYQTPNDHGSYTLDDSGWKSESKGTYDLFTEDKYQTNGKYDWTKAAIAKTTIDQTPEGDKTLYHQALRGYNSAREKFITSPATQAVFAKIGIPEYVGSDVADFVNGLKPKYHNLSTYEDYNSFLNYANSIKDTPTKEGDNATKLLGYLLGNISPKNSGVTTDETDTQDNTDEMAPPQQGGQEPQ